MYGKKSRACRSDKFAGKNYILSRRLLKNADEAYKIADYIFRNGGILQKNPKNGGILVVHSSDEQNIKDKRLKTVIASEII